MCLRQEDEFVIRATVLNNLRWNYKNTVIWYVLVTLGLRTLHSVKIFLNISL